MGPIAAYKLEKLVNNIEQILACEWVCATQALDFRRPEGFGQATEIAHQVLRRHVAYWEFDHPPYPELELARKALPELVAEVEQNLGSLE